MIIAKVNAITSNMNYKTAAHVFYTHESAKDNKESRILKTQGIVTPQKMKQDFTDISTDNQLALTTTYQAIVPYKKQKIHSVSSTESSVRSLPIPTKSVTCDNFLNRPMESTILYQRIS